MPASDHHSGAERLPSHAVSTVGGERGGAGVARRERRRRRPADLVAGVARLGRPGALEQALDALVDEEALDADRQRRGPAACRRRRTLVVARATLTRCQITEKSPSVLAVVNTRSATGLPRSRSSWASAHASNRSTAGPEARPGRELSRRRPGRRGRRRRRRRGHHAGVRPKAHRAPRWRRARGRRRSSGTTAGSWHELHSADWCGLKSPVTQARSTALNTADVRGGDEPRRTLVGLGLDGLAAAQVHQPDRRRAAVRTPPRRGTSRSARRRGCAAPSSPTGRARSCSR